MCKMDTTAVFYDGSTFLIDFVIPNPGDPIEDILRVTLDDQDSPDAPTELPDPLPESVLDQLYDAVSDWYEDLRDRAEEDKGDTMRDGSLS